MALFLHAGIYLTYYSQHNIKRFKIKYNYPINKVLHQDALLKPLNMVQQLLNVIPDTEENQDNYSKW